MATITDTDPDTTDIDSTMLVASAAGIIGTNPNDTSVAPDEDGIDVVTGGGDTIDVSPNTEGDAIVDGGGGDTIDVIPNKGGIVIGGDNDMIDTLQNPLDPADIIDTQPYDAIDTLQYPLDPAGIIETQPSEAMEVVQSEPLPVIGPPGELDEPALAVIAITAV